MTPRASILGGSPGNQEESADQSTSLLPSSSSRAKRVNALERGDSDPEKADPENAPSCVERPWFRPCLYYTLFVSAVGNLLLGLWAAGVFGGESPKSGDKKSKTTPEECTGSDCEKILQNAGIGKEESVEALITGLAGKSSSEVRTLVQAATELGEEWARAEKILEAIAWEKVVDEENPDEQQENRDDSPGSPEESPDSLVVSKRLKEHVSYLKTMRDNKVTSSGSALRGNIFDLVSAKRKGWRNGVEGLLQERCYVGLHEVAEDSNNTSRVYGEKAAPEDRERLEGEDLAAQNRFADEIANDPAMQLDGSGSLPEFSLYLMGAVQLLDKKYVGDLPEEHAKNVAKKLGLQLTVQPDIDERPSAKTLQAWVEEGLVYTHVTEGSDFDQQGVKFA
jgi:hypothetical protein